MILFNGKRNIHSHNFIVEKCLKTLTFKRNFCCFYLFYNLRIRLHKGLIYKWKPGEDEFLVKSLRDFINLFNQV